MSDRVAVVGVGLTPFGRFENRTLKELAAPAIDEALKDAGLDAGMLEMAFVANSVAAITTGQVSVVGQVVLAHVGIGGIPVYNIDNACASSSSALNLALMAIRSGAVNNALVVGVEKLYHHERSVTYRALNGAADIEWANAQAMIDLDRESVFVKAIYPQRLAAYRERWGLQAETLARISVKNRSHAALNPVAQYRQPLTVDDVLSARMVVEPLTTLMCAPIGDGASAIVLMNDKAARAHQRRPVWILGSAVSMGSPPGSGKSTIERVADAAYTQAGLRPADISLAEVHDATAFTELLAYEELGFAARGAGARAVANGEFERGGRIPVNTSGGLESRGHPIAATGGAQVVEITQQLRQDAGDRQVAAAKFGLAETAGGYAGGDSAAVVVHIFGGD